MVKNYLTVFTVKEFNKNTGTYLDSPEDVKELI